MHLNKDDLLKIKQQKLKISCGKLTELFCRAAVFCSDGKNVCLSDRRLLSVSGQQQIDKCHYKPPEKTNDRIQDT